MKLSYAILSCIIFPIAAAGLIQYYWSRPKDWGCVVATQLLSSITLAAVTGINGMGASLNETFGEARTVFVLVVFLIISAVIGTALSLLMIWNLHNSPDGSPDKGAG
jgi:hypothetical protein